MPSSELHDELETRIAAAPEPRRALENIVRRGRRRIVRRRAAATLAVAGLVAAVAVPVGLRRDPTHHTVVANPVPSRTPAARVDDTSWQLHPKEPAGLGSGTSFTAVAATTHAFLLAGTQPIDGEAWQPKIWYSTDGATWHDPPLPAPSGIVSAIATDGADALAIGVDGTTNFVLGSHDEGRTWHVVARSAELLGAPAAQMGRPFVAGRLSYAAGSWIASGGGTDGYAAIWTSADGAHWKQVLDTEHARVGGSVDITTAGQGGYLAYWATTGWYSSDGRQWGGATPLTVPGKLLLQTIAPGAAVAFGAPVDPANAPTPLLRSADDGRTWSLDARFLHAFPDAVVSNVVREDGMWVAAGTSGTPNRPDAWVSSDLREWSQLPSVLRGAPGGVLQLVAELGDRVVLLGTAPELDRYYTLDRTRTARPAAYDPTPFAADRFRCTFGVDEPQFTADGLPHLSATTDRAAVARVLQADRARILAAHPQAASISVGSGLGRAWDGVDGGPYWIVAIHDFAILLYVPARVCPRGRAAPETYEGVPLLFTSG